MKSIPLLDDIGIWISSTRWVSSNIWILILNSKNNYTLKTSLDQRLYFNEDVYLCAKKEQSLITIRQKKIGWKSKQNWKEEGKKNQFQQYTSWSSTVIIPTVITISYSS